MNKGVLAIIIGSAIVIVVILFSSIDFFYYFSCEQIESYMLGDLTGYTPHNDLTDEQHTELHRVYESRC